MVDSETPIVVFDTETTGLEPAEGHEIIEIAGERLVRGEVAGQFEALLKAARPLDPDVVAIHGITEELLAERGRDAAEVVSEFLAFSEGAILVAHNAAFDIGFLNEHLKRMGVPPVPNRVLDTLTIAQQELVLPSYSLKNVAKYLNIPQPKAHRAMADVETTREVFLKLIERAQQRNA